MTAELEERGSRFLAIAESVDDRPGAEAFFARESRAHRNPTHVVPAFRLRDGTSFSSDAGEPAGSAGPPLLAALTGSGLHDVAAVVVRWYGGTNLGVGGLVRAYGGALARALDGAPVVRCERATRVCLRYAHERTAAVMRCVTGHAGRELEHSYSEHGAELRLLVPLTRCDSLERCLRDATRGAVTLERLGEAVLRSGG
ncbi:MAG TPA: YigZ family protein [Gaiellales bacterium]|nr:YigZ family protein [Gaiellales bacterium]